MSIEEKVLSSNRQYDRKEKEVKNKFYDEVDRIILHTDVEIFITDTNAKVRRTEKYKEVAGSFSKHKK